MCAQEEETIDHLLLGCVFSRKCWFKLLHTSRNQALTPNTCDELLEWWLQVEHLVGTERNNRVFYGKESSVSTVLSDIIAEGRCWSASGMVELSFFFSSHG
ncbi:hypothetical protein SETIT_4G064200v2 [Setaria italica]|uniref:Reverse transcriptase zinc-binding domain-containing protein n=1 Tax=Setaria italica TaxID=4555 RepID=A0A368QRE6_SETIT|nr:hypothetical protein SETIT_4G064200v2 [Setaria italica]